MSILLSVDQLTALKMALHDDDPSVRFNAGLDLVQHGDEAGISALIEAFEQDKSAVRLFYAGKALVEMGKPAIPALTEALSSTNHQVQVAAAFTFYQIDNTQLPRLLPIAIAALQSENEAAFEDAIRFLGEVGAAAQPAVPTLLDVLRKPFVAKDPDAWILDRRVATAVLLAKIGSPLDKIVPALIEALGHDADGVRWAAACALGEIGALATTAIPALTSLIRTESEVETIRVEAAYTLAVIGHPETDTAPVLLDALHSDDWWVRAFAARILGEMGMPPSAVPDIDKFDWFTRIMMGMHDLNHLTQTELIVPALAKMLQDPNHNVRRNVAYALGSIGTSAPEAISTLAQWLNSADLGPLVAEALAKIGPKTIPTLIEILNEKDEIARTFAAYALTLIDTPDAKSAITTADRSRSITQFKISAKHFFVQVHVDLNQTKIEAFETLYQETVSRGIGSEVNYQLPYPKHEFLRYLVEHKGFLMHGSNTPDIEVLKPLRRGIDGSDHGNVSGVYADMDPIRPIYFAIVHGGRCFGLQNGFFEITKTGERSSRGDNTFEERYYKLAIGVNGLRRNFCISGMIYVLPPDTFEFWNEWTSRKPVQPIVKLAVEPDDLPLISDIWGADWRKFGNNWVRPEDEFPFMKDARVHPILPSGKPAWLSS